MSAANVEAGTSATGLLIDGTRALFGGTRAQGLRAGTSRFLEQGWFVGWKVTMVLYCIVWAAWWDRGEDIELRIFLATWTHMIATAYFVISTISALLCMAYISRETPAPVEEGKPKPPAPVKATRSPVPCYFRWLQHVSWVLACLSSMVVMAVYWLAIYNRDGVSTSSVDVNATILSILMVADQFLIASEFKIKYAWLGVYYFVVYIFFNVGYYYNTTGNDRLTYYVFDWGPHPGRGCLWVFLILAIFVPGFSSFHYFVYRLRERMYVSYKHKIEPAPAAAPAPAPVPAEEKKPDKPAKEAKEDKEEKKESKGDKPKEGKGGKKSSKKESAPPLSPEDGGNPPVYWPGYGPPPVQYAQPPQPPADPLGPPPAAAPKTSRLQPYMDMLQDVL